MTRLVLDCSVTMAWCFEDETCDYADLVLDSLRDGEAWVPAIWPLEVSNVLVVAERRARLTQAEATRFLQLVGRLPLHQDVLTTARAFSEVMATARLYDLSCYDAAYLELALRRGVALATLDNRLKAAAASAGVPLA